MQNNQNLTLTADPVELLSRALRILEQQKSINELVGTSELYVLVAERDTQDIRSSSKPIVFEVSLDQCTREAQLERAASLKGQYGTVRLARLQIIDEPL